MRPRLPVAQPAGSRGGTKPTRTRTNPGTLMETNEPDMTTKEQVIDFIQQRLVAIKYEEEPLIAARNQALNRLNTTNFHAVNFDVAESLAQEIRKHSARLDRLGHVRAELQRLEITLKHS